MSLVHCFNIGWNAAQLKSWNNSEILISMKTWNWNQIAVFKLSKLKCIEIYCSAGTLLLSPLNIRSNRGLEQNPKNHCFGVFQVCPSVSLWSEYVTTTNFHVGEEKNHSSGKNESGTVKFAESLRQHIFICFCHLCAVPVGYYPTLHSFKSAADRTQPIWRRWHHQILLTTMTWKVTIEKQL